LKRIVQEIVLAGGSPPDDGKGDCVVDAVSV